MRRGDAANFAFGALIVALAAGCESSRGGRTASRPAPAASARVKGPPRFIAAPLELAAVEPFIQEQSRRSRNAGARTLVYVGASWCEPCQRFHAAVERGELDALLAGTNLVEFDDDRHSAALHRAGYAFEFIPVLAIPDADGRSSGRLLSGSIAGPAAVDGNIVPRLQALLDGREVH